MINWIDVVLKQLIIVYVIKPLHKLYWSHHHHFILLTLFPVSLSLSHGSHSLLFLFSSHVTPDRQQVVLQAGAAPDVLSCSVSCPLLLSFIKSDRVLFSTLACFTLAWHCPISDTATSSKTGRDEVLTWCSSCVSVTKAHDLALTITGSLFCVCVWQRGACLARQITLLAIYMQRNNIRV